MAGLKPGHYALSGRGYVRVMYARTLLAGQPQLTHQHPQLALQFSRAGIRQVDSERRPFAERDHGHHRRQGLDFISLPIPRPTMQNGQPAHIRTFGGHDVALLEC